MLRRTTCSMMGVMKLACSYASAMLPLCLQSSDTLIGNSKCKILLRIRRVGLREIRDNVAFDKSNM